LGVCSSVHTLPARLRLDSECVHNQYNPQNSPLSRHGKAQQGSVLPPPLLPSASSPLPSVRPRDWGEVKTATRAQNGKRRKIRDRVREGRDSKTRVPLPSLFSPCFAHARAPAQHGRIQAGAQGCTKQTSNASALSEGGFFKGHGARLSILFPSLAAAMQRRT